MRDPVVWLMSSKRRSGSLKISVLFSTISLTKAFSKYRVFALSLKFRINGKNFLKGALKCMLDLNF